MYMYMYMYMYVHNYNYYSAMSCILFQNHCRDLVKLTIPRHKNFYIKSMTIQKVALLGVMEDTNRYSVSDSFHVSAYYIMLIHV